MNIAGTVIANSAVEVLSKLFGDVKFELAPTIFGGLVVGVLTMIGGLLGGKVGLLIGGSVGSSINSRFGPKILTLSQMVRQLDKNQIMALYTQLSEGIINIAAIVAGRIVNRNLNLANLLEMFSGNSQIRSNILQIITDFFKVNILKVFVHIGAYFAIFIMHICIIFGTLLVHIIPVSTNNYHVNQLDL